MFKSLLFLPLPALLRGKDLKLSVRYYWKRTEHFYFDLSISFRILRYEVFKVR